MSGRGRPPRIRQDYIDDAQLLLQLSRAVKADTKRPQLWRTEVIDGLKHLAERLIQAPPLDTQLDLITRKEV